MTFPFTGGGQTLTDSDGRPIAGPSGVTTVEGNFAATGVSLIFFPMSYRDFNIVLGGTFSGVVELQRSFDYDPENPGAATWVVSIPDSFRQLLPPTFSWNEPEYNIAYRLSCSSLTSGSIDYRLSQ